jgi:hypothetical protein
MFTITIESSILSTKKALRLKWRAKGDSMKASRLLFLAAIVVLFFLYAQFPAQACQTTCADGSSCDTNLPGGVCTCSCGSACCGRICPICGEATAEELSGFKQRIDDWSISNKAEVRALSDVAANLYTAVLLHDHEGYEKAYNDYTGQVRLLSADALREINTNRKR